MREDEYLDLDFFDITDPFPTDRREFLKLLGGGIFIFVTLGDPSAYAQERRRRSGGGMPSDFNAFLRIGEDGRVSCFTGKIEMGQGIVTSLAQMLADELNVSLDSVDMVMGDTDLCPWDMGTFGSRTTRFFGPSLRAAAAEAKAVLMGLAAERFKQPVEKLVVEEGVIYHGEQPDLRITYAELTEGRKIERRLKGEAVQEAVSDFTIVGEPTTRRDGREKVTGEAKFAGDIRPPGMLCAKILRPPAHDAALESVDTSEAERMEGVRVVKEEGLVAVLHERPDVAEAALATVKAEYNVPKASVDDETIFDHLLKAAPEGRPVSGGGDLRTGEELAVHVVEGTYLNSYVAHAPIEPHTAVVQVEGREATVWASTQAPFRAKEEAASALGFPSDKVRVITPFVGGGFGGKTRNQQVTEAARLAKACGRPVQVAWTRAEEFFYDTFRPASVVKIRSGMDGAGRITFWDYHVYFAGERGSQHFYDIPHHATESHGSGWRGSPGPHPFGTGAWRAPANNSNTHARESHIDMMAAKAGIDPLEFRLKNLKDERMLRVLKAAAEQFEWKPMTTPSGRGFGIACGIDSGTYIALMAEVEVDKARGDVRVKRVVCTQDMGLVINPEGARIQMEGCITMGLGYALFEEIRFKGGKVLDKNFGTYKIPRFSWLPEIETVLIDAKDAPPQGGGEPAIIGMGGVIANAVFDAVNARLYQLPMTPGRIKKAMEKS